MGPQIIQHVSNWVMLLSLMEKFMVLRYLNNCQYGETALSENRLPLKFMVCHHVPYYKLPFLGVPHVQTHPNTQKWQRHP
jgi:hypothetical protein